MWQLHLVHLQPKGFLASVNNSNKSPNFSKRYFYERPCKAQLCLILIALQDIPG